MHRRARRDERGSIAISVMVILVATSLIVTTAALVDSGLRSSRRAGDSANALQLADAAVNDAIKRLTDYAGPLPLVVTGTLGTAGSYTATADKESEAIWHIDAVGTDATGVQRRVKADALAQPLFANAVFAQSTMSFQANSSVDSFVNGLSQANTCTGKGFVGTNSPATTDLNVSGGGAVRNCTRWRPGGTAGNSFTFDGCVGYNDGEPVPDFMNAPPSGIPTGCGTALKEPELNYIAAPDTQGLPLLPSPLVCSGSTAPLSPGSYLYPSIQLGDGCRVASTASATNPVVLFSAGGIQIGATTGTNAVVNQPPSTCADTTPTGDDGWPSASPLWYYCAGQAAKLQVFGVGTGSGNSVRFANGSRFWGVVYAPAYVLGGGSGNPQATVWGALTGSSVATNAAFAVHYDESLARLTTRGRFAARNWREEPLGP